MECKKRIKVTGMNNLRDLGGYEGTGGMVAWQKLYRSDLPLCNEDGWKQLMQKQHLATIIDLRSTAEKQMQDYQTPDGIKKYHIPLIKEMEHMELNKEAGKEFFMRSMGEQYLNMVLGNPEGVVSILTTVTQGLKKGSVLFHCTAGKDRTGIISFFLYELLGVDRADILADYQVSSTYNLYANPVENTLLKELSKTETQWMHSQPENLGALMAYFEKEDMEHFLIQHGMEAALLDDFKQQMIEHCDSSK